MWGAIDLVTSIPLERWDVDHGTGASPDILQTNMLRFAALADGIERFDAAAFRLGPAEAAAMDPQQRILLEQCHAALQVRTIASSGSLHAKPHFPHADQESTCNPHSIIHTSSFTRQHEPHFLPEILPLISWN